MSILNWGTKYKHLFIHFTQRPVKWNLKYNEVYIRFFLSSWSKYKQLEFPNRKIHVSSNNIWIISTHNQENQPSESFEYHRDNPNGNDIFTELHNTFPPVYNVGNLQTLKNKTVNTIAYPLLVKHYTIIPTNNSFSNFPIHRHDDK